MAQKCLLASEFLAWILVNRGLERSELLKGRHLILLTRSPTYAWHCGYSWSYLPQAPWATAEGIHIYMQSVSRVFPVYMHSLLCSLGVSRWWHRVDAAQNSEVLKLMLCLTTVSSRMHSVYLNSLKAELLRMAFQMWDWIWGRWSQHKSSSCELEVWQIASSVRNICLLSCSPLVNIDASYEENQLWDWKSETQVTFETFCRWLKTQDTTLHSCVLFMGSQTETGGGFLTHDWLWERFP